MSINRYDSKRHRDKNFQLQFRYVCPEDLCERFFHGIFYRAWKQGCGFFRKEPNKAKKGHTKKITKWANKQRNIQKIEKLLTVFEKSVFMHATSARMKPVSVKKNFEKAAEYCQWWILVLFPTFKIVLHQRLSWKPFLKTTSNYMALLIILLLNL